MSAIDILITYYPALLGGLLITLELFLAVSVLGIIFGIILGSIGARYREAGLLVKIASFLLASIPFLILMYWFYYPLQSLFKISIEPFFTALVVLALVDVMAIAEIVRGVLAEFPRQYISVAQMSGLSNTQILRKIQFPMIFRQIIPSLLTTQVYILQITILTSLISVPEIFRVAQNINAVIYKPIEIYTSLALLFMVVLAPINYLAYVLKQRLTRDLSEH